MTMGSSYLTNAAEFLINTFFNLYLAALILRFLLQTVRADFYNPISQTIVKITNPLLIPLRRILPSWGNMDTASLLLALLIASIKIALLTLLLSYKPAIPAIAIIIRAIAEIITLFLNIYLWAIVIQIILSWINPGNYHPINILLHQLTEPLLKPARKLLPSMPDLDLSPMLVIILLQLSKMILLPPIYQLAN